MNETGEPGYQGLLSRIWLVAFVVSGALYMVFRDIVPPNSGWFLKILPIALLLQLVLSKACGTTRTMLAVGLILSATGDTLLSLEGLFIPGLGAFLLAQLTYTGLFLTQFRWQVTRIPWALIVVAYTLTCTLYIIPLTGDLKAVTAAYMLAISLMALSAAFRRDSQFLWVAVGALIFMISDTLIAVDKFVASFAFADTAIMATYYLAQALIVVGMVRYVRLSG